MKKSGLFSYLNLLLLSVNIKFRKYTVEFAYVQYNWKYTGLISGHWIKAQVNISAQR